MAQVRGVGFGTWGVDPGGLCLKEERGNFSRSLKG